MNNLIIIGNGFDLAHKMETSYEQFMKYIIESNGKEVVHKDLFTTNLNLSYTDLKTTSISYQNSLLQSKSNNQFLKSLFDDLLLKNWCDIEEKYFELLSHVGKQAALYKNPLTLNSELEIIKMHLSEYLKTQEKIASQVESYKSFFSSIDSNHTVILNFNYTDTLKRLYSDSLKLSSIIHGELENEINPIVFGYAATDLESRALIDKKNNEYMRNIKKHLYKQAKNEALLIKHLIVTKKIDVSILGHSCGLSDKLILSEILNHDNVSTIRTFYYENYENYFNTMVNIDRIMNDDVKFKNRIIDFNSSPRMPQIKDSELQTSTFIKYIDELKETQNAERPRKMSVSFI